MAWKSREPSYPTVRWGTRQRALLGPCARGGFKLNYVLSDECLYSPCSVLFYISISNLFLISDF